jgi:cell division protein ZapE
VLEKNYQNIAIANNFLPDQSQIGLIEVLQNYQTLIDTQPKNPIIRWFSKPFKSKYKGMYIWGDVGRGKSLIINLFYDSLAIEKKTRVHFHEFMISVHKQLNQMRRLQDHRKKSDYIKALAKELASNYKVICLDELQINNVADAMIVGRLFKALSHNGTLVFFSSNFHPDDLFKDGLQRERFLPFISYIKQSFEIYNLNNHRDYRLDKLGKIESAYLTPLTAKNSHKLDEIIEDLTGHKHLSERNIHVDNQRQIRCLNTHGRTAVFTFKELCEIPLGAIDYLALCKHFSTIIIRNIPKLKEDDYNEALRFITLIDCLYDSKTRLICSAEVKAEKLYTSGKFAFEFKRTISRLNEMQTSQYLKETIDDAA